MQRKPLAVVVVIVAVVGAVVIGSASAAGAAPANRGWSTSWDAGNADEPAAPGD